jgi:DNA-binding transcriptional MerR regulator
MLGIGEFAGLTGLSVKALRHYDENNVLVPADIDGRSAYRRYSETQVRAGVVIQALRGAGVSLPAVSDAIASSEAERVLLDHRPRVLEQRESEDRAHSTAVGVLPALAVPVNASERMMPAQPFMGQDDANQVFDALFAQLHGSALGPSGQFWTALRAGERGTVELVCCWPTFSSAPERVCGPESFYGMLPSRTELVATWRPIEELPGGSLHPAIVGLFESIADRNLSLGDVEARQTVLGQRKNEYTVEVSITVSR